MRVCIRRESAGQGGCVYDAGEGSESESVYRTCGCGRGRVSKKERKKGRVRCKREAREGESTSREVGVSDRPIIQVVIRSHSLGVSLPPKSPRSVIVPSLHVVTHGPTAVFLSLLFAGTP